MLSSFDYSHFFCGCTLERSLVLFPVTVVQHHRIGNQKRKLIRNKYHLNELTGQVLSSQKNGREGQVPHNSGNNKE